jgi:HK97 family phage major capsid protein
MQQHIDLSSRELRDYGSSLHRSILDLAANKKVSGVAGDVSKAIAATSDRTLGPGEMFVQLDGLRTTRELAERGLSAGTENLGGFLVGTQLSDVEAVLRPASVLVAAGARIIQLKSNMAVRREVTASTAQWLHETDTVTEQTEQFGQLTLQPHRCSAFLTLTRQMQHQVDPDASDLLVASMRRSIAVSVDRVGLNGAGVGGEPVGIFQTAGVQTVTFSAAATWANALSFVSKVAGQNATDANIMFVSHPSVREKWANVQRASGTSTFLWADNDTIAGKPALVTTNCPSTSICCGDFSNFLIGLWGPAVATVDPFTNKRSEKIEIVVTQLADVGAVWPNAFCINSGSVTQ